MVANNGAIWAFGLLVVLVVSGCTSQSSTSQDPVAVETDTAAATAEPTAVPTEEPTAAPTAVPTPAPTEVPTPEPLSDADMIALAVDSFDANPQPSELIAWDHLDATVLDDRVRLEICSWTGDTVFDDLRTVEYEIQPDGTANHIFDGSIPGDCLNTELIDSALDFTSEYDTYWVSVLEDPTTFEIDDFRPFATEEHAEAHARLATTWTNDGTHWEGQRFGTNLLESSVQPVAWRRYQRNPQDLFELLSCREIPPGYGLYRGDLLLDDERGPNAKGENIIDIFRLTRTDDQWAVAGVGVTVWADCFTGDWLPVLNSWRPEPTEWDLLP